MSETTSIDPAPTISSAKVRSSNDMTGHRLRVWFWGVVWLACAVAFGLLIWHLNSDFSSRWKRLKPNMTADEVRTLLGEPDRTHEALTDVPIVFDPFQDWLGFGYARWFYYRPSSSPLVRMRYMVAFDGEKVVDTEVHMVETIDPSDPQSQAVP